MCDVMPPEDRQKAVLRWLLAQPEDSAHSLNSMSLSLRMIGADIRDALDILVIKGDAYRYTENGVEVYCVSAKAIREARKT